MPRLLPIANFFLNSMWQYVVLYHKSNLVYTIVFPQFLIFQQNNSAQASVLIFFTSRHYCFFEKLKIVEKQLCKLNCSYGKVSHTNPALFYGFPWPTKSFDFFLISRLFCQTCGHHPEYKTGIFIFDSNLITLK